MAEDGDVRVLGFPEYAGQSKKLAAELGVPCELVDIHRFPDGESRVRLPIGLPPHVVFCRSLNQPNDKLVELTLAAGTARELGARRLTLVAPYLCYMRQDTAFEPGEAVSQAIVGRWLGGLFDRVITVDPHLHRTATLDKALPDTEAIALSAAPLMADYVRGLPDVPVLVAPDGEAEQWVAQIARLSGAAFSVATKQRRGDRDVSVELDDGKLEHRVAVLVDDIISTGETMAAAVRLARSAGAREIHCLVTHPLFCEGALERLTEAGAHTIISSDSISHDTNRLRLAPLIAPAVR
ncbi:MAG: ribose-phosphate diphosphokinase [Arenicellales bacterium]